MLNAVKNSIVIALIKISPKYLIFYFVNLVYLMGSRHAFNILRRTPLAKIENLPYQFVSRHHILTQLESSAYKVLVLDEERYESIRTPNVYQLVNNNFLTLNKREIAIYCFPNAKIRAKSDIVKIGNNVFWEKANRPEFAQVIPADCDYLAIEKINGNVTTFTGKTTRHFGVGYNLCGVHTNAWAHFVVSYLPKLISIRDFFNDPVLKIFVPNNILQNNKDLIYFTIENLISKIKIEIIYVDDDETIECSQLYHCSDINYLCDHTKYMSPASSCISIYGAKAIHEVANRIWLNINNTNLRKLYIGRGSGRNLINASEVEDYFLYNGFEIIHPHLMTLEEKINIFGNASHIVGPVSSGFANFIFSKNKIKILGFSNFTRAFDTFISGLNSSGNFNHELMVITGDEEVSSDINNSFYIELKKIKIYCEQANYFD